MFRCVKRLAMEILAYEYAPTILVADSAKSITKGFKKVFTLLFRIDCWAHVDRNIDKNMLKHVNEKKIRESIKADIDAFQNNVETEYVILSLEFISSPITVTWYTYQDYN